MVDRVVAIVGNRPVLSSQVDEEVFSRQSQGAPLPKDPDSLAALRKQVVASIVDEELLVQQAQRDTAIKVTDQEIADGVEQQVRKVRGNFTSEVDYKNELKRAGFGTPEEYRRWLTDQQRRAAFQNRLIEKLRQDGKLKPVSPTEPEIRAYFNEQKGALGNRPATLSFRQIVIAPRPAPEAKARTKAQADSIVLELRRGADFATAAKRFSQDPGSKDQGGSLNWFRRGVMVPEFERVAFALRPGVVSDPVESPFGYHIIQVERVQPGEVQARHILLIPTIDSIHVDSARALADSVRKLVLRSLPFDSLQRAFHDPSAEKQAENVPADKLPEAYAKAFGDADSGAVAAVFSLPGAGTRDAVRRRADHRTAPPGRYPLRGRARPDSRPARPAARHPALHRPAQERDLRGGPLIATRLAITLGDPRGIGPEITARALAEPVAAEITIVGAEDQIAAIPAARRVGVGTWGLGSGERADDRARVIRAGRLAGHAVEAAVKLALQGEVDAIVTAPAHKHALHLAGFPYPGHTEWLAKLAGDVDVAMMLASPELRVVLVTTHVPFRDVPALLTVDRVTRTGRITQRALREWFGIASPRLAVCAVNPHAGESGLFGDEEQRVLRPAAEALGATGPLPADTVFVRALRGEFDAVLAPYHDVGMTAIKVASFGRAVNVTLGLPFPRTSPDHGTALDIAGTGTADASSMRAAIELALKLGTRPRAETSARDTHRA